ncbi:SdpA family antimicrobial peptide system protein [Streptomyces sp. H27-S2]|uniref:SdpA family antimicrobial peptide system protein n=1 Tax=Streptomyces antarcticus TaxID=2996458 RepID=UPI0022719FF4|nr:SdpA family antimicrobial peptide system protein [Streptomyces sp. H27-S2]MCY0955243.1 SdpA family antimicrobial peptide system protein [Streptomyces sp. H27-S2]
MRINNRIQVGSARPEHLIAVPRPWIAAIAVLWTLVSLYIAQSFLPHNVLPLPAQADARKAAAVVAPQGWAFFTKSAKDPQYAPYRLIDGGWKSVALTPHSRPSNFFGFDRAPRSQGIEIALLLHQEDIKWSACESSAPVADCLARSTAEAVNTVTNPSPSPSLCGRAAVAEMRPVPWAWRHLSPERHTPQRVAVWEVRCP